MEYKYDLPVHKKAIVDLSMFSVSVTVDLEWSMHACRSIYIAVSSTSGDAFIA